MIPVVGVSPPAALAAHARLFEALAEAYELRFEARLSGEWRGLAAAVWFGAPPEGDRPVPVLVLAPEGSAGAADIDLHLASAVDPLLRGRSLRDAASDGGSGLDVGAGDEVCASRDGTPIWVRRADRRTEHASVSPPELAENESLRDVIRPERFISALPLIQFLRWLTAATAWEHPPLRAAFQLDDPNLHWRTYGHVHYPELVRDAAERNYHAAMAMIPLDGWFAHPRAAQLFRERGDRLSLLMHGNDHVRAEFARDLSAEEGRMVVAQALRRVADFERRTKVPVARVMVAPHGECSDAMLAAMSVSDVEALCIEWPYFWRADDEPRWLLSGWEPAEFLSGTPVIPRHPIALNRDEVLFRALLGGPIVLTGHHGDLARGLDVLRDWAGFVNGLGDVRWQSLGSIVRSNVAVKREGSVLRARLFTRRARVEVPDGVEGVAVELPGSHGSREREQLRVNGLLHERGLEEPVPASPGTVLDLRLERQGTVDAGSLPPPPWRPWPIVRRVLSESRDRISACF